MNIYEIESDFSVFEEKTGILGDFANILWSGFVIHSRQKDHTKVERFGAYVPPIYVESRQIILTEETKPKIKNC